jgi:hypothetical protein
MLEVILPRKKMTIDEFLAKVKIILEQSDKKRPIRDFELKDVLETIALDFDVRLDDPLLNWGEKEKVKDD